MAESYPSISPHLEHQKEAGDGGTTPQGRPTWSSRDPLPPPAPCWGDFITRRCGIRELPFLLVNMTSWHSHGWARPELQENVNIWTWLPLGRPAKAGYTERGSYWTVYLTDRQIDGLKGRWTDRKRQPTALKDRRHTYRTDRQIDRKKMG